MRNPRLLAVSVCRHLRPVLLVVCWVLATVASAHPGHESGPPPKETDVVAVIFSDFYSKDCGEVDKLIEQLATARHLKVQKIFKHAPANPDALLAHEAALAAGAQGQFQAMHDLLFKQSKPAGTVLINMASSLGLDLERFEAALDDRQYRSVVLRDIAEARGMGVQNTPTIFLNGTKLDGLDSLRTAVRIAITPPPPPWVSMTDENLELDVTGSPFSGPTNAPVTLIEFTDFRCGFCRLHSQALNELTATFPGLIHRVFKHYPLDIKDAGMLPHLSSMAAHAQGRFWEMHLSLMAKPLDEAKPEPEGRALSMGMDTQAFLRTLKDPSTLTLVNRDRAEGERLGIRATPTSFLNGRRLVGRQSIEVMSGYINAILESKGLPGVTNAAPKPAAAGGFALKPISNLIGDDGAAGTDASCERPLPAGAPLLPATRATPPTDAGKPSPH